MSSEAFKALVTSKSMNLKLHKSVAPSSTNIYHMLPPLALYFFKIKEEDFITRSRYKENKVLTEDSPPIPLQL